MRAGVRLARQPSSSSKYIVWWVDLFFRTLRNRHDRPECVKLNGEELYPLEIKGTCGSTGLKINPRLRQHRSSTCAIHMTPTLRRRRPKELFPRDVPFWRGCSIHREGVYRSLAPGDFGFRRSYPIHNDSYTASRKRSPSIRLHLLE
jgi:hypothetical protein